MIEWWSAVIGIVTAFAVVVVFFVRQQFSLSTLEKNQESIADTLTALAKESQKRLDSATGIVDAIERLHSAIEKFREQSTKEHNALMKTYREISNQSAENQRDIARGMATDHKEMILLLQSTKDSVVSGVADLKSAQSRIDATLDAHVRADR